MSLFSELKRRNVFRVAVAYIVASWLVLQVVDVVQPILKFPDWVAQLTLLLLVLGFIAALIISWAYEITPEGIKRESEVEPDESVAQHTAKRLDKITIALVLVAIAVVVVDRLIPEQVEVVSTPQTAEPAEMEPESPAPEPKPDPESAEPLPPSVAVLPFANMSADEENEYFADGISEELLNLLVRVEGLRVPSRTSSFAFKGQNRDIREIASELEVNHILEGSVRKAGNQVRITAQLIDVTTDTHLWSETYDRELEDIFAIQDEISGQIVESMHLVLGTRIVDQKPTENLDAYTLYLQGRELYRQRSISEDLTTARELLQEAAKLDPGFGEAWALLAMVEITIPGYTKENTDPYVDATMELAQRALEFDPTLVEARLAIAQALSMQGETISTIKEFNTIIEQSPRHSQARLWFAISLYKAGYLEQAFEQISVALELDPIHTTILDWFARIAVSSGHPDLVMDAANRSIQLGRFPGRVPVIQYHLAYGTVAEIEPYLENEGSYFEGFRWAFKVRDNPQNLQEGLEWIQQNQEGTGAPYMILALYRVSGSVTGFYEQLDRIQKYDETVDYIVWLPGPTDHRSGIEFTDWARKRGYDTLWQSYGPPDLCQSTDAGDWECD